jgi:DNA-binding NarL/FixJ family response regulator
VEPIHVAIVIASKLERLGWSIVVDSQEDMAVAGQFSSFDAALAFLGNHSADVALVDEAMLVPGAWEALGRLSRRRMPRLLILAQYPPENPLRNPHSPVVSRHLLKGLPAADLLAAIREAVPSAQTATSEVGRTPSQSPSQ